MDQDKANSQAIAGIKTIEKQMLSLAGIKPLDPMAAALESFDLKAEQIQNKIARLRELNPFDQALVSLEEIEDKLPDLRKQLQEKMALEIKIKGIVSPIERLEKALQVIASPEGLVTFLSKSLGESIGKMSGLAKGIGGAVGGAIGGLIGGIAELGKKSPDEIEAEMNAFLEAFQKGLLILPDLLVRILPKFMMQFTGAILKAIPLFIRELINALAKLWTDLTTTFKPREEETRKDYFKRLGKTYAETFSLRSGGRIPSGRNGLKFTSGTFGGAGLAMLHPNEYVVPSSGQRPQAIDRQLQSMNGSGGMSITINSMMTEYSAVDSLVKKIEQRFTTFGGSTSNLFAG